MVPLSYQVMRLLSRDSLFFLGGRLLGQRCGFDVGAEVFSAKHCAFCNVAKLPDSSLDCGFSPIQCDLLIFVFPNQKHRQARACQGKTFVNRDRSRSKRTGSVRQYLMTAETLCLRGSWNIARTQPALTKKPACKRKCLGETTAATARRPAPINHGLLGNKLTRHFNFGRLKLASDEFHFLKESLLGVSYRFCCDPRARTHN